MSTGSYKSASSVSESSASSGSQPPSSSSSEEVHTCHRCGDCCYSDKSRVILNIGALPEDWIEAQSCEAFPSAPGGIGHLPPLTNIEIPFSQVTGGIAIFFKQVGTPPIQNGDPPYYVYSASRLCASNRWSFGVSVTYWDTDKEIPITADIYYAGINPCAAAEFPTHLCCGASGSVAVGYWDDYDQLEAIGESSVSVSIEVLDNPCCRDTITDECFQHFGGDCRGDCDEAPGSSSGSSSGSEGNPLP